MASNYIYEPIIKTQVDPVESILIEHNFGRGPNVAVYDIITKQIIFPRIEFVNPGIDVLISFFSKSVPIAVGNFRVVIS